MTTLRHFSILAILLFSVSCATAPKTHRRTSDSDVVAFTHAAVIPMDREQILRDHTVVFDRDTIVAIGPSVEVKIPPGAQRIDATGRYLLPALSDMHVHIEG